MLKANPESVTSPSLKNSTTIISSVALNVGGSVLPHHVPNKLGTPVALDTKYTRKYAVLHESPALRCICNREMVMLARFPSGGRTTHRPKSFTLYSPMSTNAGEDVIQFRPGNTVVVVGIGKPPCVV